MERLHEILGQARVELWLCGPEKGSVVAQAAAGRDSTTQVRYAYSQPLPNGHGYLLVEITSPAIDLDTLPRALRKFGEAVATYSEQYRLDERRAKLISEITESRPELERNHAVLRASCLMAKAQGISPAEGWMCLLAESALTERTLDSVAQEVVESPAVRG